MLNPGIAIVLQACISKTVISIAFRRI